MHPAIPSIPSWRDGCDGIAIPSCTAIPDGQPWRDGTSRDLEPRDALLPSDVDVPGRILSLGLTTNGWETTKDPNGQNDHRGAKIT
ncbi:hypothetical protein BM1_08070 [Bipolaris maydis]|nr:hypothetical protein BM1_08070 [Bipolaris maydis]